VAGSVLVGLLAGCGDEPSSFEASQAKASGLHSPASAEEVEDGAPIVRGVATSLYGPIVEAAGDGNVAYSPSSIATALGMARAGAEGESAAQLDAFFGADGDGGLHRALNAADATLRRLSGPERNADGEDVRVDLTTANALWGQSGTTWKDPFLDELLTSYDAAMWMADYRNDADRARSDINRWIAERTDDRIPELLQGDAVNADTRMVLTNAVRFAAPWDDELDELGGMTFTRPDGSTVEADAIGDTRTMGFQEGDGWVAVTLPYAGGDVAMTLLVPDEGQLATVEAALDAELLEQVLLGGEEEPVDLRFPRFDLDQRAPLRDALESLGVTAPFEQGTEDFAPMTDDEQLFVADVVHQATVTVDEEGTEAAAATAVTFETVGGTITEQVVLVDRPFLFVVHDVESAIPVFLGRVTDPTVP
jgi:serpin B